MNALKHAGRCDIRVSVSRREDDVLIRVQDDGKGFDVSKLTRVERSGRGAGLFTMRERTSLLGGSGFIESSPGNGTKITVTVPVSRNLADEEDKSTDSR